MTLTEHTERDSVGADREFDCEKTKSAVSLRRYEVDVDYIPQSIKVSVQRKRSIQVCSCRTSVNLKRTSQRFVNTRTVIIEISPAIWFGSGVLKCNRALVVA